MDRNKCIDNPIGYINLLLKGKKIIFDENLLRSSLEGKELCMANLETISDEIYHKIAIQGKKLSREIVEESYEVGLHGLLNKGTFLNKVISLIEKKAENADIKHDRIIRTMQIVNNELEKILKNDDMEKKYLDITSIVGLVNRIADKIIIHAKNNEITNKIVESICANEMHWIATKKYKEENSGVSVASLKMGTTEFNRFGQNEIVFNAIGEKVPNVIRMYERGGDIHQKPQYDLIECNKNGFKKFLKNRNIEFAEGFAEGIEGYFLSLISEEYSCFCHTENIKLGINDKRRIDTVLELENEKQGDEKSKKKGQYGENVKDSTKLKKRQYGKSVISEDDGTLAEFHCELKKWHTGPYTFCSESAAIGGYVEYYYREVKDAKIKDMKKKITPGSNDNTIISNNAKIDKESSTINKKMEEEDPAINQYDRKIENESDAEDTAFPGYFYLQREEDASILDMNDNRFSKKKASSNTLKKVNIEATVLYSVAKAAMKVYRNKRKECPREVDEEDHVFTSAKTMKEWNDIAFCRSYRSIGQWVSDDNLLEKNGLISVKVGNDSTMRYTLWIAKENSYISIIKYSTGKSYTTLTGFVKNGYNADYLSPDHIYGYALYDKIVKEQYQEELKSKIKELIKGLVSNLEKKIEGMTGDKEIKKMIEGIKKMIEGMMGEEEIGKIEGIKKMIEGMMGEEEIKMIEGMMGEEEIKMIEGVKKSAGNIRNLQQITKIYSDAVAGKEKRERERKEIASLVEEKWKEEIKKIELKSSVKKVWEEYVKKLVQALKENIKENEKSKDVVKNLKNNLQEKINKLREEKGKEELIKWASNIKEMVENYSNLTAETEAVGTIKDDINKKITVDAFISCYKGDIGEDDKKCNIRALELFGPIAIAEVHRNSYTSVVNAAMLDLFKARGNNVYNPAYNPESYKVCNNFDIKSDDLRKWNENEKKVKKVKKVKEDDDTKRFKSAFQGKSGENNFLLFFAQPLILKDQKRTECNFNTFHSMAFGGATTDGKNIERNKGNKKDDGVPASFFEAKEGEIVYNREVQITENWIELLHEYQCYLSEKLGRESSWERYGSFNCKKDIAKNEKFAKSNFAGLRDQFVLYAIYSIFHDKNEKGNVEKVMEVMKTHFDVDIDKDAKRITKISFKKDEKMDLETKEEKDTVTVKDIITEIKKCKEEKKEDDVCKDISDKEQRQDCIEVYEDILCLLLENNNLNYIDMDYA